jgi:hypothetical protein
MTLKRILMGLGALLLAAVIILVGMFIWKKSKTPEAPKKEAEVQLLGDLGKSPETPETLSAEPALGEPSAQPPVSTAKEPSAPAEKTPTETAEGIPLGESEQPELGGVEIAPVAPEETPKATGPRAISRAEATPTPRETRPAPAQGTRPTTRPGTEPTQPPSSSGAESVPGTTPTPIPTTPTATPAPETTPESAPLATPVPGNYTVRTIVPVLESQLAAVRKAMAPLGVQLQEKKTSQQQLTGYRIAVGYFQSKTDAQSWSQYSFRPRGIKYYIYPVQGMYSIQVGVYTQQQTLESALRELDRKFQGWRLPVRTEMTMIAKSAYELSSARITESLARRVQDTLFRLGIQTEVTGM